MEEKFIDIFYLKDWTKWLEKNHEKENKIGLVLHKKHTGKNSPSHKELMFESICFGWIDTTIRRLDDDRYIRFFCKRNKNSKWSNNTLRYAKELKKEKRMKPLGIKFYNEGLKKLPHDHGLPKNPEAPDELKTLLEKNKTAKRNFENIAPSLKRNYIRWILRAKLSETRKKRINQIMKTMSSKNEKKRTSWEINKK